MHHLTIRCQSDSRSVFIFTTCYARLIYTLWSLKMHLQSSHLFLTYCRINILRFLRNLSAVGCWCWDESLCVKNPFPFPVILTYASKLFQYPTRVNRLSAPKKLHQSKSSDDKKIASDLPVLQNVIPMLCCGQINLSPRFLLKPVLI